MTVNKLSLPAKENAVQLKINEIIDNLGGTATDVQINGTSITSNNVANIKTNSTYNATSNKIATMSDVPSVDSALSTTSENPVQNKVITSALDGKADKSDIPTYNFYGVNFYSADGSITYLPRDCNSIKNNGHFFYSSNGPSGLGETEKYGALYAQAYNQDWVGQIAQDYRTGNLFVRSKNKGTWTDWKAIANKNNIPTIATSVSSGSTNAETVGAKLFYDTVGNIESALNTINSGSSS